MTPENFCYWLQGYVELTLAASHGNDPVHLTNEQVRTIQSHLQLVFEKVTNPLRLVEKTLSGAVVEPPVGWPTVVNTPFGASLLPPSGGYPLSHCSMQPALTLEQTNKLREQHGFPPIASLPPTVLYRPIGSC